MIMNTRQATTGNWLTQSHIENEDERIFVKNVSGFGDLDNIFTEWSDEQKAEWEKEHPQEEVNE